MSEPEQLVRRLVAAVNTRDLDALDDLVAEGPLADDARRWIGPFAQSFPDFRMEVVDVIADGDRVVGHFRCSGTHEGEWLGHPPTGRAFKDIDEIYVFSVRDGRLAGTTAAVEDNLRRLRQLGLVKAPAAPERMRALVADGAGGVAFAEVARPRPAGDEVLVRVRAASLNRGELRQLQVAGQVPGWDVAGELLDDVPGLGLERGRAVLGMVDAGAWAEFAAVPVRRLAAIPEGVTPTAAAALPVAGLTALQSLRLGGSLLGRRVLITGASGGVGRFAVQLARLGGARVTAVARRAEGLRELGADAVAADVAELDGPFDFILESVGGESLTRAFALLAPGGDLVSIGQSSGEAGAYEPRTLFNGAPGGRIHPYMVFAAADDARADLATLLELVRDGRLDPQVERVVGWDEAQAALADLAARSIGGKAVMRIGPHE